MTDLLELVGVEAKALQAPSPALLNLLEVFQDEAHDLEDVGRAVGMDPALTGAVLRLANSASMRRSGPQVSAVRPAVSRIGERTTFQFAVNAAVACLKVSQVEGYGYEDGGLRRHALRTAVAAELLCARSTEPVDRGTAYVAGLLCDIGKLAMGRSIGLVVERLLETLDRSSTTFHEAEHKVVGTDHAAVGGDLVQSWGLPERLVQAVRFHHQPSEVDLPLVWVVHVADLVALHAGSESSIDGLLTVPDARWARHLKLRDAELDKLVLRVRTESALLIEQMQSGEA